jgi:hypothetical protein
MKIVLIIIKIVLKILGFALAASFAFIFTFIVAFGVGMDKDMFIERPLGEYTSTDGTHVCSVHVSDGGVTIPSSVVAQVEGKGILGKRTIYSVEHIDEAVVIWVDDRTVWINGVLLDIYRDKYVSEVDRLYGP